MAKCLLKVVPAAAILALCACGASDDDAVESADEYAARIGGQSTDVAAATSEAAVMAPAPGQTDQTGRPLRRAITPGSYTDPAAKTCGAPQMEGLLGNPYTDELGEKIASNIPTGTAIRVVQYGAPPPDGSEASRLNVMLDQIGVVRDFRCG